MSEKDVQLDLDDLAPISVSVYTRLEHFRQCIESLANNHLAKHSKLYVFSDAAKPGDEERVGRVREYAKTITGFKEVVLKFQETNGYLKNMADAREIPLVEHGTMIRLEDDNIVSSRLLDFINEGLVRYKDDYSILSVTGYAPPIGQSKYVSGDVYLSLFYGAWVTGVWRDKPYLSFLASEKPYSDMMDSGLYGRVMSIHPGLPNALKLMDQGVHHAGDQKLSYYMIKHNLYQLKPVKSLVKNIGHDGSGIHCGSNDKFDVCLEDVALDVGLDNRRYNPRMDRLQYRYFHGSWGLNVVKRILKNLIKGA